MPGASKTKKIAIRKTRDVPGPEPSRTAGIMNKASLDRKRAMAALPTSMHKAPTDKVKAEIGWRRSGQAETKGAALKGVDVGEALGEVRIIPLPHGVSGDDAEILLLVKEPRMNWLNVFKHRRLGPEDCLAATTTTTTTDGHFSVFDKTKLKGAKEKVKGAKIVVFDPRVPELVAFVSKYCSRMLQFTHQHDTRPADLDPFLQAFRKQTCVRIGGRGSSNSVTHATIGNVCMTSSQIQDNARALVKQLEASPDITIQFVIVETASGERNVVYDCT
ncbi:ribosomal L1p/L10e family protein [Gregarina niphandrodes]|uniref:Ribosomal L1p/L10e family protein n=1 Tax=Gregarina niphandrodes TaxID=110365 RepID=A0A023B3A0_GRENI|nr:ribosomal L1p/L10e family protein [Gregarina niphandrodes]EZG55375.1 ribosomal L1p/L10e family protein [Gregarina niphandrodes]|eukprot:XP_011131599.1 ribosomal L1p/L10e family protein [Gregarina niphandrodes]